MSAFTDWQEIYQSYSAEELAAEIVNLKKLTAGGYVSQSVDGKTYSRDPNQLRQQLAAAIRVQTTRAGSDTGRTQWDGVVKFNGVDGQA